ncbi:general secretion pathway protein L [Sphingomonas jejuensis]|uniref:General secretion pathway protein L n=1 Tax=Sphingomonas jejuensis TaxID=904715 RepID=A0ABX0XKH7_9SPHN|nr:type II secretion system protein GspL [Sphingomonas jejuensis]NJC33287.1 general secretion pathway protein L [Sphingomonas jejuensis]
MATIAPPLPRVAPTRTRTRARSQAAGTVIAFLPTDDAAPIAWQRFEGGVPAASGPSLDTLGEAIVDLGTERVVAVAPAADVTLHWAELPGLATAQARAAARLMVAEQSLVSGDALHVAVGDETEDGERPVAAVATERMSTWLARLAGAGIDPSAIVAAPLLLPLADEGFTRAAVGGETVYRGRSSGFADDPVLTPILVEARPVTPLTGRALDEAVLAGAETPVLDLRQGAFARSRRGRLDWALVRRLGWLALAIAAVSLLIGLVSIMRLSFAADAAEREAAEIARSALPRGTAAGADPVLALDRALAGERGGGLGFTTTAGVLFGAVQAVPGVELTGIDFGADGVMRAALRAPGAPEVEAIIERVEASGLEATPSPFQASEGRVSGELRIALP